MSKALLCPGRYCVRGASVLLRLCGGGLWLNDYVGALVSGLLFWGACVVGAIMSVVLFLGGVLLLQWHYCREASWSRGVCQCCRSDWG